MRLEFGWRTDLSNELYYEQTFDDTTVRPARLRTSPEAVHVAVVRAAWGEPESPLRARWGLGIEGRLGDLLQQADLVSHARWIPATAWTIVAQPQLDWQRDRTFDRDRRELRGGAVLRARHELADGATRLLIRGGGDWLRSEGAGSEYVLDHDVASGAVAIERSPWGGPELRFEYGVDWRVFPDSTVRDHAEQHVEGSFRRDGALGSFSLSARAARRRPHEPTPSARDLYWMQSATAEGRLALGGEWTVVAAVENEWQHYDHADSSLYFDYGLVRSHVAMRAEAGRWAAEVGPRTEWLASAWNPGERYVETGGEVVLEWLGNGALWSFSPAAGWREYPSPGSVDGVALHSSFAFAEASLLADQPLPGRLRLRAFGFAKLEHHADSTQDTRSLYFSVDVRRLF